MAYLWWSVGRVHHHLKQYLKTCDDQGLVLVAWQAHKLLCQLLHFQDLQLRHLHWEQGFFFKKHLWDFNQTILHTWECYIVNLLLCEYQLCKVFWRRKCSCNVLGLRLKLSRWHPTLWVGQVDWGICIWILASGFRCFHLCTWICEENVYLFRQLPGYWNRVSHSIFWPNFLPTLCDLQVSLFLKTSLSQQILSQMYESDMMLESWFQIFAATPLWESCTPLEWRRCTHGTIQAATLPSANM